jgi:hypothetical protein
VCEGSLKFSRPNKEKNEIRISKLFSFFNKISLKINTFIPEMIRRHYTVPLVVLRKICKIPLYGCSRLLFRRKTLTSKEESEFWEERSQKEPNLGNRVDVPTIHRLDLLIFPNLILSILSDTDNTPASDSCIKQTT